MTTISAAQAALPEGLAAATLTITDGRISAVTAGADPSADTQLGADFTDVRRSIPELE